jgi:hypothetical protein
MDTTHIPIIMEPINAGNPRKFGMLVTPYPFFPTSGNILAMTLTKASITLATPHLLTE